jgi:hypothetical protein
MRRRSTRTSEPGTLRALRTWSQYAPSIPSAACAECVLHACLCASLISRVFVCPRPRPIEPVAMHASAVLHSFRVLLCEIVTARRLSRILRPPNRRRCAASSASSSLRTHSAHSLGARAQFTRLTAGAQFGQGSLRACGSARRRFSRRRRSTRTSQRGTLLR